MALGVTAYTEAPFGAEASDVIAYPLGIELTTQENSGIVIGDANVPVTGTPLVSTVGDAIGSAFVLVETTGQSLSSNLGTVTEVPIGQQVDVTGFELTANASNPTHDTLTAFGEAPFATLSPATFNIPVGIEATTGGIVGTFPLPMSLGDVVITGTANLTLTGQALTSNLGSVAITADANVDITGQELTAAEGTVVLDANTFAVVSGEAMTVEEGTVFAFADVDVAVTGQELTMQENAPTVTGDANVSVTGIGFTANLGTAVLDANTLVDLTGQAMTMQEGTATAPDSLAILTGIEMTMAEGSIQNIIWNPVDTGNAPIDPPGWKEVA
jgi:hypothetical protein